MPHMAQGSLRHESLTLNKLLPVVLSLDPLYSLTHNHTHTHTHTERERGREREREGEKEEESEGL